MTTQERQYHYVDSFELLQIMDSNGTLAVYREKIDRSCDSLLASRLDLLALAEVTTRRYVSGTNTSGETYSAPDGQHGDKHRRVVGIAICDGFFDVAEDAENFCGYFKPDPGQTPDEQRQLIINQFGRSTEHATVLLPGDTPPSTRSENEKP